MSYVLLQCVKEGSKLKVKMVSTQPFIKGINCQFPRNIRQEGMYYVVKSSDVKLRGTGTRNFYSAIKKGAVVCQTFDLNEVKKYINNLAVGEPDKIMPAKIFGEDEDMECIICMCEDKNSVFVPCGHYMTCGECAARCKSCPICRANIVSILRRDEIVD